MTSQSSKETEEYRGAIISRTRSMCLGALVLIWGISTNPSLNQHLVYDEWAMLGYYAPRSALFLILALVCDVAESLFAWMKSVAVDRDWKFATAFSGTRTFFFCSMILSGWIGIYCFLRAIVPLVAHSLPHVD